MRLNRQNSPECGGVKTLLVGSASDRLSKGPTFKPVTCADSFLRKHQLCLRASEINATTHTAIAANPKVSVP